MKTPAQEDPIIRDEQRRSEYVREFLLSQRDVQTTGGKSPLDIVQFWDNPTSIPLDVQDCLSSWSDLRSPHVSYQLFDDTTAQQFISEVFDERHVAAFKRCPHPAMRADYFRLCFIASQGGCYVDADDLYQGNDLDGLATASTLKIQPLCYDITTDSMVDPREAAEAGPDESRIFYVNNNPLISPAAHPVLDIALERSTGLLIASADDDRDVQSLTGPGNLTASLVHYLLDQGRSGKSPAIEILWDWENTAMSKWPLSYRPDERNWRNWRTAGFVNATNLNVKDEA